MSPGDWKRTILFEAAKAFLVRVTHSVGAASILRFYPSRPGEQHNLFSAIHESIGDVRQTQVYPSYDGTLSLCTIYFELLLH